MADQCRDGAGREHVVGVGEDHDRRSDFGEPEVDRLRLAETFIGGDDRGSGMLGVRRGLGVGVGHHHDIELARITVGEDVAHLGPDALGLRVGRNEHGDRRPLDRVRDRRDATSTRRDRQPCGIKDVSG